MRTLAFLLACGSLVAQTSISQPPSPLSAELLQVKRVYVAPLAGGPSSESLRELIIAGLASTNLFILTENPDRADATLKGAADDHTYVDIFDSSTGLTARQGTGKGSSDLSSTSRS